MTSPVAASPVTTPPGRATSQFAFRRRADDTQRGVSDCPYGVSLLGGIGDIALGERTHLGDEYGDDSMSQTNSAAIKRMTVITNEPTATAIETGKRRYIACWTTPATSPAATAKTNAMFWMSLKASAQAIAATTTTVSATTGIAPSVSPMRRGRCGFCLSVYGSLSRERNCPCPVERLREPRENRQVGVNPHASMPWVRSGASPYSCFNGRTRARRRSGHGRAFATRPCGAGCAGSAAFPSQQPGGGRFAVLLRRGITGCAPRSSHSAWTRSAS